jgi:hypothetical protein
VAQPAFVRLPGADNLAQELIDEMTSDVAAQNLLGNVGAATRGQDFQNSATDVGESTRVPSMSKCNGNAGSR